MFGPEKMRMIREMEFNHYHESRHYKIIVYREIETKEILLAIFADTSETLIGYQYLEANISIIDMMIRLRQNLQQWVVNTECYKLVKDKSYKIVTPKIISEYEQVIQEGLNTTKKLRKKIDVKTGKIKETIKSKSKKPIKRKTKSKSELKPTSAIKKDSVQKNVTRKTIKNQAETATALF